jgi:hypothetical protein
MATRHRQDRILDRDLAALRRIGRWRCLARYHLKEWIFPGVDEAVVSRFVARMTARGYLGAKRLHGIGAQLLWLTHAGRDFLVEHGTSDADLYPAKNAVALKDLDHTLAIVSAGFALTRRFPAADAVLPAWAVQRAFGGRIAAIPDVLCIDRSAAVLVACEIDIGGESVALFADKVLVLGSWLASWSADAQPAIVILTSGERRAANLAERIGPALDPAVALAVEVLPKGTSRDGLVGFCRLVGAPLAEENRQDEVSSEDDGVEDVSA